MPKIKPIALSEFLQADAERLRVAAAAWRRSGRVLEGEVQGGSMGATLSAGARIRVNCRGAEGCAVGDVVVFVLGRELCVHRVVYRPRRRSARAYLVTRGDDVSVPDPLVSVAAVLGPVTAFEDATGWHAPGSPMPCSAFRRLVARAVLMLTVVAVELSVPLAYGLTVLVAGLRLRFIRRRPLVPRLSRRVRALGRSLWSGREVAAR